MRATVLEISPTPSARARSLTRVKQHSRRGRNTSPRERFLLVGRNDDVINPFPRYRSPGRRLLQRPIGKRPPATSLEPIGCAVVRRQQGKREVGRGAALSPRLLF